MICECGEQMWTGWKWAQLFSAEIGGVHETFNGVHGMIPGEGKVHGLGKSAQGVLVVFQAHDLTEAVADVYGTLSPSARVSFFLLREEDRRLRCWRNSVWGRGWPDREWAANL